jgi:hypothetical protein
MRIEYKATRHRMTVSDTAGKRLVAAGIAREVEDAPKPKAETQAAAKPKRAYRRRDMQAAPVVPEETVHRAHYITRDEQAGEE